MNDIKVYQTGIRSGEVLTSSSSGKQNAGTIMQVRMDKPYLPSYNAVSKLADLVLRDQFNNYKFFSEMTVEQRREWLLNNSIDNDDLYLEDHPMDVRFKAISGKFFTSTLSPEQITMLLQGNPQDPEGYWSLSYIYSLFPRKPGSKARKTTLIFRPSNWSLAPMERETEYNGLYIDLDNTTISNGRPIAPYRIIDDSLAIKFTAGSRWSWDDLLEIVDHSYHDEIARVRPVVAWFPPALHKSLIQKLIRTRCAKVVHDNIEYNPKAVLLTSMITLALHAGSFVPNIQRFVSGLESMAKRTAVAICEDSWLPYSAYILSLYAGALLAQTDRSWRPPIPIVKMWFDAALYAQDSPYNYDRRSNGSQFDPLMDICTKLLTKLGSFKLDIEMMGNITRNGGNPMPVDEKRVEVMDLTHCVDHHTWPSVVHYLPYTQNNYSDIIVKIWDHVVGINPRIDPLSKETEFIAQVQKAQKLQFQVKADLPKREITTVDSWYQFTYELTDDWLAGLIGPLELRLAANLQVIVVLRTDDIYELTPVIKPARDAKVVPRLSDEDTLKAKSMAKEILSQGYKLSKVPHTLKYLEGSKVYLRDDQYWIEYQQQFFPWVKFKTLHYRLPNHPSTPISYEFAIFNTGKGVSIDADSRLQSALAATATPVLRRTLYYLQGSRSIIKLNNIGRDGTGVDHTVVPEDTGVHWLLTTICCLYPGVLEITPHGFIVKCGPLLWIIKERLRDRLNCNIETFTWPEPTVDSRALWEHQKDAIEALQAKAALSQGALIWIPVGMGKTLIVIRHIIKLIENKSMPKYCIYTLPASAIDSVKREFATAQIATVQVKAVKDIRPGVVNLVEHDDMRRGLEQELKRVAPAALVIVDEFHKTLNKTIRTSIALELIRLSHNFIGMSGTIIKDSNPKDLILWLEQVVHFEVTESNYWVAIGSLISKRVETHVIVERAEVEAPLLNVDYYKSLVPAELGGTALKIDFKAAVDESYRATGKMLLTLALYYINQGEVVFINARDAAHQHELYQQLSSSNIKTHMISKNNPITLLPNDPRGIQAVISTKQFVEGYQMTAARIAITEVIFSNQATREQWEGRINRISQPSPKVLYVTVHAGILSYILKRYRDARNLSEALKGLAAEI